MSAATDAAARVRDFLDQRARMRHLDPVQITAAHSDPERDMESPLTVADLRTLADATLDRATVVTMFLPAVYERWEHGFAARKVVPTLAEGIALLEAERAHNGAVTMQWRHEFGGATATVGDLIYEVQPVEVSLP